MIFDDELMMNHKYQSYDSQPSQRKIKHLNGEYMFKSSAIDHSPNSRMLHDDSDAILTNNYDYQSFHQPNTRKITKITPKETSRVNPVRSTSATNGSSTKHELKDAQRLKNVRRHEPVPVSSGPESKKFLITPDSWKTHPVQIKAPVHKKPTTEIVNKPKKAKPTVQQQEPVIEKKPPRIEKPNRARSTSKPPPPVEEVPVKKATREKSKEEKEKIQKYIREKREEHEKSLSNEKNLKKLQEKDRKEKLQKLNEQIKKVAPIPIPASLLKKSSSTHTVSKDHSEQTRQRLLDLLGPKINIEPPIEYHSNTPFEQPSIVRERSVSTSSSSSASSDSVVEIQPPRIPQPILRPHSESHVQHNDQQRHQNILRWAMNLTRDCDDVENKLKFFRPDGTQPFDIIPPSRQVLQHHDGNLRSQPPIIITNNKNNNTNSKPIIPSKILRPSGRLSRLNQNHTSEYQNQQLPGVGNLRDPSLERRVKHDRAAIKIQAAYRGYTVRKSLQWINQNEQRLENESNRRPVRKSTKRRPTTKDSLDIPPINLDLRFSDDNFTIGSTLLRNFQRNGMNILPTTKPPVSEQPPPSRPQQKTHRPQEQKIQRPPSIENYSDDYENVTSTRSLTPIKQKQIPEKPRVIQQPVPKIQSSSSESTSTSSSITPTPKPEPHVSSNIQRRRSISPPLPPQMSSDNGRPIHYQPPPSYTHPPPTTTTIPTPRRVFDERRYSPDALERQLNAELHLLDGVEASMQQIENMERLRSIALAQQEVVSLAQVLRNKPPVNTLPQQSTRKSPAQQVSSSTSSPSSSPPANRRRATRTSSSSSESILTEREKGVRQKFHDQNELQAYEKRLKDVENKLRLLSKRDNENEHQQAESNLDASDIYDEKRIVSKPRPKPKSSNESSISEDLPISHKSTTSLSTVTTQRKATNDLSEIHTEINNISARSIQEEQPDSITTDASDIERRVHTLENQATKKKNEVEKLRKQKEKEELRRKEEELKKQVQTYNQELEKLRIQPSKTTIPVRKPPPPPKSSNSSSSETSTPTKPQESSIAEELPAVTSTASQSEPKKVEKRIEETRPKVIKKERDFFDDDDDDEEEKKPVNLKPLVTPRDEQNTQHDALSISTTTDIAGASETDNDDSRRQSTDHDKPILNFNTNASPAIKPKEDFETSSSSTSTSGKVSKPQQQQQIQRKASPIANDYDEDFSELTHSHNTPSPQEPVAKVTVDDLDIESIQEDIENKRSIHDNTNQSLSSKSSNEEQSEILVLNKKSTTNTPRKQDDKTPDDDYLPPPSTPRLVSLPEPKIELNNANNNNNNNNNRSINDDTSGDVSEEEEEEEEEEEVIEQETKIDKLTELFLRTFIDEAIDQGKQIERSKKEDDQKPQSSLTEQFQHPLIETTPKLIEPITTESNLFAIDLSGINDEPRVESPRKPIIEEVIKPFVPHTREQAMELCHQAVQILLNQNTDFSDRLHIQSRIPNSYFTYGQQDSDTDDIHRSRHAYCQMVFDLCLEILHEMDSPNVQSPKYPNWQKSKLISKRFYRGKRPTNRRETEQIVQTKVLEMLNLTPRQITYSKWRVSNNRRPGIEKFEIVLDEEIRRTEPEWINYDDDAIQIRFDVSDLIFDQLIQETLTDCFDVVNKRLFSSSDSTRL